MEEVIDYKYRDIGKDTLIDKRHSHWNCIEIVQVIAGEGTFVIDDKIYPLESGAVYLINGDIHCSNPGKPEKYVRNKIVVSSRFLTKVADAVGCGEILDYFRKNSGPVRLTEKCFQYVDQRMRQIGEALASDQNTQRIGVGLGVLDICNLFYQHSQAVLLPVGGIPGETIRYINDHLTEKIVLDELSGHINISKYHLCRMFRKATGMTITDYILNKRLAAAKRMLTMTDESLSEIAMNTGFGSFSYFSSVFKREVGMSPREFRRQNAS